MTAIAPQPAPAVAAPAATPPAERAGTAGAAPAGPASGGWSPEIQALRALAVGLVVIYHLWPGRLGGGYVGVDVFFVISGFLISGNIVRDLRQESGRRFGLVRFYVRRARRLLPAAMVVLLCVAVGVVLLLPSTQWVASAQQVLASAVYAQNWVLAGADVDYLSPTVVPTAVQHFWSLSVEEQFYLVWPLLLAVTAFAARRGRRVALGVVMASVAVVSFVHGVRATEADPAAAYFWSTTRVWEFAVGGLLAVVLTAVPSRSVTGTGRVARGLLAWAGFGAIAASALMYTDRTPFPGTAALLPVIGTLMVIAAGTLEGSWSPASLVSFGPVQFAGDISYSLYLWHWPLIVLAPAALGVDHLGLQESLTVLGLSVLLAWLTMLLVERPLRAHAPKPVPGGGAPVRPPSWQRLAPVSVIVALTLATGAVAGWAWYRVDTDVDEAARAATVAFETGTPCFGAAAMRSDCEPPLGDLVTPHPAAPLDDFRTADAYKDCSDQGPHDGFPVCEFGNRDSRTHVVLFGDSHATQWAAALDRAANEQGWRLTTILRSKCTPNAAEMVADTRAEQRRCHAWAKRAIATIAADRSVDVVVTSSFNARTWEPANGLNAYETGVNGYRQAWARFVTGGRKVLLIKDTPRPEAGTLDCVARSAGGAGCTTSVKHATRISKPFQKKVDPMVEAVRRSDPRAVSMVDLLPAFCPDACPAVIGNVLVHVDTHHISPTYARTLAPEITRAISGVLAARAAAAGTRTP